MITVDRVWLICRLVLGILSVILSLAVLWLELFGALVKTFSLNGPDGSEGKGFVFVLIFLAAGVLAILNYSQKAENAPLICTGLYGLGVLIAAYIYRRYDFISLKQSMRLYGLICLVFAAIFAFSVC